MIGTIVVYGVFLILIGLLNLGALIDITLPILIEPLGLLAAELHVTVRPLAWIAAIDRATLAWWSNRTGADYHR